MLGFLEPSLSAYLVLVSQRQPPRGSLGSHHLFRIVKGKATPRNAPARLWGGVDAQAQPVALPGVLLPASCEKHFLRNKSYQPPKVRLISYEYCSVKCGQVAGILRGPELNLRQPNILEFVADELDES